MTFEKIHQFDGPEREPKPEPTIVASTSMALQYWQQAKAQVDAWQEEHPFKEAQLTEGTLVASSNRGRYALDEPNGPDITSGQPLVLLLAGHQIAGRVEHSNHPTAKYPDTDGLYSMTGTGLQIGYYFIANDGGICGLCVGMRVRIP